MKGVYLAVAVAAASLVSAHTIFTNLQVGTTTYPLSYGIRDPSYDGPIYDVTSNNLACNGGANPTTPSPYVITVPAGESVNAVWRHTLQSGANDVLDPGHMGPTLAYLKKVTSATTDPGYGPGWFKIQEAGYDAATKVWATDAMIDNAGKQAITIPACIEPGLYLLRAEVIALHGAGTLGGAQFYMECAQLNITGGTGAETPTTYSIPGIYKATDPGIHLSIYWPPVTNYTIPGPALFTC